MEEQLRSVHSRWYDADGRPQRWAHGDPSGRGGGFWEIGTSAQLDFPMQTRVIEIVDNRDRTLSLFCSLIDQAGPADPVASFGAPGRRLHPRRDRGLRT